MSAYVVGIQKSREITHEKYLVGSEDPVGTFIQTMSPLGPHLLQLPPSYSIEGMVVLEDFLTILPRGPRYAVEVCHRSWLGDRREFPSGHTHPKRDRTEDLAWWSERVDRCLSEGREVFAYANNHYQNHSPSTLQRFLEIRHKSR